MACTGLDQPTHGCEPEAGEPSREDVGPIAPGPESREVGLFSWDEIPWNEIAFPSVNWSLDADRALGDAPPVVPATNPTGATGGLARGGL